MNSKKDCGSFGQNYLCNIWSVVKKLFGNMCFIFIVNICAAKKV